MLALGLPATASDLEESLIDDNNSKTCASATPPVSLAVKILFTFENPLPSAEADAEVFVTTARHLAPRTSGSWLHVPASDNANCDAVAALARMPVVRACAPLRPAVLRHLCCGLTLVFRREFRHADRFHDRQTAAEAAVEEPVVLAGDFAAAALTGLEDLFDFRAVFFGELLDDLAFLASALAMESASQSFLLDPPRLVAFRLLSHAADPSSPAISFSVRFVRTE